MSKPLTKAQKEAIIYKIRQNREAKVKEIRDRLAASFVPTEEQSEILADLTRAKELSDELDTFAAFAFVELALVATAFALSLI